MNINNIFKLIKKIYNQYDYIFDIAFIMLFLRILHIGCIIKYITGISCPGCGMTRACLALMKLDIKKALYYHPMVIFMPILVLTFLFRKNISKNIINIIGIIFIIAFLVIYLYRLILQPTEVVSVELHKSLIYKIYYIIFHTNKLM